MTKREGGSSCGETALARSTMGGRPAVRCLGCLAPSLPSRRRRLENAPGGAPRYDRGAASGTDARFPSVDIARRAR